MLYSMLYLLSVMRYYLSFAGKENFDPYSRYYENESCSSSEIDDIVETLTTIRGRQYATQRDLLDVYMYIYCIHVVFICIS